VAQVTGANVQDHHQIVALVTAGKQRSPELKKVWVDEGYQGNQQRDLIHQDLQVVLEIVPRPPGKGFQVLSRRWVVERTFAWLGRYRRLSKDYEFDPDTALAFIQIAMSHLMVRRLARRGGS
jgi:putative transposase